MPRPEVAWAACALVALACIALAGFMVSPRTGLVCTGLALLWFVKLGTARRD